MQRLVSPLLALGLFRTAVPGAAWGGMVLAVAGLLLLVGGLVGASVGVAHADPPGGVARVRVAQAPRAQNTGGEHEDESVRAAGHSDDAGWASKYRPDSPVAEWLMKNLVCMCGGCKRETLYDCKCGPAAIPGTRA